ncbi:MAG: TAXI family TRAP transporter solute-binding subunit [SAR324 cluster bacterium]|nr:TAXI family TRAP transporter solute-binding subunit [SAR324 cluster bacterium]
MKRFKVTPVWLLFLVSFIAFAPAALAKDFLKFSGGPSGGTFQYFSNGMSIYLSKELKNTKVSNQASRGSVENIRKLNSKRADFGIAYSGDLYLARNGKLSGDTKKYMNVRALSFLYKAPAQLVVLANSGIKSVEDLKGKKVALGGAGSGAAASAERFFRTVGLWDKIDRQFLGYSKAASAMKDGHVDAMWVLAGYPTRAVIELAASNKIRLLQLNDISEKKGLFKKMPFYQKLSIPAGTYEGVDYETTSFFDSALWVVNKKVKASVVEKAMTAVYAPAGLEYLISVKKTAKQMSMKGGATGIVTPLHKGAEKFWKANKVKFANSAKAK